MGTVRLPAYTRRTRLASGQWAYFWELPSWARPTKDPKTGKPVSRVRHGRPCPVMSTALGTDTAEAFSKAENLCEALKEWRTGTGQRTVTKGTVDWLFIWYREQERFKSKAHKTRVDYRQQMDRVAAFEPKKGQPLGKKAASKIYASDADRLYEKLKPGGVRQATYAMQVCRLVWKWAVRHKNVTGVTDNPFSGMGLVSTTKRGNRETSRAEYDLYRETARKMGYQSMATAAALCFECCQRVWDAFGFEDPDKVKRRGIEWAGYKPGVEIALIQSKTGNAVTLPLFVVVRGEDGKPESVPLYPELEDELARSHAVAAAGAETIVLEERNGLKYTTRRMSSIHRKICVEAGLPKEMTFTGFRHGGITELGASGEDDVRAVSGHKTLAVTAIYNKATTEKARQIALVRRQHIERLGGEASNEVLWSKQNPDS
jgi:hypothetical protein